MKPDRFNLKQAMIDEGQEVEATWRRVFARLFDYTFFNLFLVMGFIGFASIWASDLKHLDSWFSSVTMVFALLIASGILSTFLWIFIEATLLARNGTTPGKSLMGLSLAGRQNDWSYWFERSFYVWYYGLACGVPILNLLAMLNAYVRLMKRNRTWWDKRLEVSVKSDTSRVNLPLYLICVIPLVFGQGLIAKSFVREYLMPFLGQLLPARPEAPKLKDVFKGQFPSTEP